MQKLTINTAINTTTTPYNASKTNNHHFVTPAAFGLNLCLFGTERSSIDFSSSLDSFRLLLECQSRQDKRGRERYRKECFEMRRFRYTWL